MHENSILQLANVSRHFMQGDQRVDVLSGIDITIGKGEMVALVGASGSGKTTLLQIAGLLDTPSEGSIHLEGNDATRASDDARTQLRSRHIGFVYQFHMLLPEFSALENVMLPQLIAGVQKPKALAKAGELLGQLGLSHRLHHRPAALSGGEQQRVAIARALANDPALILADEPTGNLDSHTAESVFTLFLSLARSRGLSLLVATHNPELAKRMDRVITLQDGNIR